MAWFKVDDGLHASAKTRRAGDAMALWVMAGSWCADQLTDGWLPEDMAPVLTRNWKKWADKLIAVGLWIPEERNGQHGWRFHDWEVYQPTRVQVLAEREAAAERQRRAREKAKESRRESRRDDSGQSRRDSRVSSTVSHGPPDPTRPVSTKDKVKTSSSPAPPATEPDPDFALFWRAYPRKVSKPHALKAWGKVVKEGTSPEVIISGAERYARERKGEDVKFTAHPATWLNGQRWDDTPHAAQRLASGEPSPWWEN